MAPSPAANGSFAGVLRRLDDAVLLVGIITHFYSSVLFISVNRYPVSSTQHFVGYLSCKLAHHYNSTITVSTSPPLCCIPLVNSAIRGRNGPMHGRKAFPWIVGASVVSFHTSCHWDLPPMAPAIHGRRRYPWIEEISITNIHYLYPVIVSPSCPIRHPSFILEGLSPIKY